MKSEMNRRGFFRLLGGVVAVGTAMGVHPKLLAPLKKSVPDQHWHHVTGLRCRVYFREVKVGPDAWSSVTGSPTQ